MLSLNAMFLMHRSVVWTTQKAVAGSSRSFACLRFVMVAFLFRRRKIADQDAARLKKAAVVNKQHAVKALVVARRHHALTAKQQKVFV